jgi:hypothetical protein
MKKIFLSLSALVCMTFFSGCFTLVGTLGPCGSGSSLEGFVKYEHRDFHVTDIYGNTPLRDFVLQGHWADAPEQSIYLSVNYERMCKEWNNLKLEEKQKITPMIGGKWKDTMGLPGLPDGFSKITQNYQIESQKTINVYEKHVKITGKAIGGLSETLVTDIITSPIQVPAFTIGFSVW